MINFRYSIILAGLVSTSALLSGCNQSLNTISPSAPPSALPSAPTQPVTSGQLPPISTNGQQAMSQQVGAAPATPDNQPVVPIETASVDSGPTSSSVKVTREGMAGSWQVPTDSTDCRIILAFTKWSGGYRAATRRCASPEMQTVNAWDVKDQSVVLVDQSGNEVARLFGTSSGRYDGRTKGGQPVSFTR